MTRISAFQKRIVLLFDVLGLGVLFHENSIVKMQFLFILFARMSLYLTPYEK